MSAISSRCRSRRSRAKTTPTDGAIAGHSEMNVTGAGPGFGLHIVDVEVDKETGAVDDQALHGGARTPARRSTRCRSKARFQGGAVQGIGWALNEEYYLRRRWTAAESELPRLSHAGRIRRADDRHRVSSRCPIRGIPYGLRGVGEVPVMPTMAAIANAIGDAIGIRPRSLPMSPPKLLKLIEEAHAKNTG